MSKRTSQTSPPKSPPATPRHRELSGVAEVYFEMRLSRGWSRDELAEKAGLPVEEVAAYESNPAKLSSLTACRILDVMPPGPIDGDLFDPPRLGTSPPRWLLDEMDARVHEWKAALDIDLGKLRDAMAALDHGLRVSPSRERTGRLLITKAAVAGEMHWEERALDCLYEAEPCFDPVQEPHLWLRLRLEQIHFLCHFGRYSDAADRLPEVQGLADRLDRERERRQVRHLAGWIAAGLGKSEEAVRIYQPLYEEQMAAGNPSEAACLGLELAALWAAQGNTAGVAELDRQLEPLTTAKKIPQAARATLKTFHWAVERNRLTVEMSRRLVKEFLWASTRLMRPFELPV